MNEETQKTEMHPLIAKMLRAAHQSQGAVDEEVRNRAVQIEDALREERDSKTFLRLLLDSVALIHTLAAYPKLDAVNSLIDGAVFRALKQRPLPPGFLIERMETERSGATRYRNFAAAEALRAPQADDVPPEDSVTVTQLSPIVRV
jgi:hypothetical protein